MKIIPGRAQHIGFRVEQQDTFGFSNREDAAFVAHGGVLAILADGMGGLARGREASQLAVETVLEAYAEKTADEPVPRALRRALTQANEAVYRMAKEAGLAEDVGTTLTAAVIHEEQLFWVSVGDSRIYLYRAGQLTRLTLDHTYANELTRQVAEGKLSRAEAEDHPDREALTSFVGLQKLIQIDSNIHPFSLQEGDRVLLCSDGLYGSLTDGEMIQILSDDEHPFDAHERSITLINRALDKHRREQDNLTVLILTCEADVPDEPEITLTDPVPEIGRRRRRKTLRNPRRLIAAAAALITLCAGIVAYGNGLVHAPNTPPVEAPKPQEPPPSAPPTPVSEPPAASVVETEQNTPSPPAAAPELEIPREISGEVPRQTPKSKTQRSPIRSVERSKNPQASSPQAAAKPSASAKPPAKASAKPPASKPPARKN